MNTSKLCLLAGIASIPLSIVLWCVAPDFSETQFTAIADTAMRSALADAHAERWGIFVGLWAPTLICLSLALKKNAP